MSFYSFSKLQQYSAFYSQIFKLSFRLNKTVGLWEVFASESHNVTPFINSLLNFNMCQITFAYLLEFCTCRTFQAWANCWKPGTGTAWPVCIFAIHGLARREQKSLKTGTARSGLFKNQRFHIRLNFPPKFRFFLAYY